jgi:hypothetical protein
MTPHLASLDQWLAAATKGLSADSAARVREEIQQHYDSSREAGDGAADVMSALGNPRTANRAYRKVLLTEQEALMAPALAQHKRPDLSRVLLSSAAMAVLAWWQMGKNTDLGRLAFTIGIFCTLPFAWIFPPTTLERSRIYISLQGVRNVLVLATIWWYDGWMGALALAPVLFLIDFFFSYRRLSIFRKLAAGQTYSLLPEEPQLTHAEAVYLNTLRKGGWTAENVPLTILFVILAGMTAWMPAAFAPTLAPMLIWTAASYLARRTLPIYTEERSRWFRIAKWTTMAVAALSPFLYGARAPWIGASLLALFFVLLDMRGISLRRKLPVAQWPKRLYW